MVALGAWGMNHRPTTPDLTVRARLLAESRELTDDLIDELRELHLGIPRPHPQRPKASEQLQQAHEAITEPS